MPIFSVLLTEPLSSCRGRHLGSSPPPPLSCGFLSQEAFSFREACLPFILLTHSAFTDCLPAAWPGGSRGGIGFYFCSSLQQSDEERDDQVLYPPVLSVPCTPEAGTHIPLGSTQLRVEPRLDRCVQTLPFLSLEFTFGAKRHPGVLACVVLTGTHVWSHWMGYPLATGTYWGTV